jgi:hypothetical protein
MTLFGKSPMNSLPNDANGDALRRLAADGSDLSRAMPLEFHVAAPSEKVGQQLAQAQGSGFTTSVWRDDETGEWTCTCTKTMVPDHAEITRIEQQLDAIAQPVGGHADGWGTFGNAPAEAKRPWWKVW